VVRPTKTQYYLNLAEQVATRSTCNISKYGCVIVKNDIVVSTGYNGSPRGTQNCSDTEICLRDCEGLSRYNQCRSVHSEANALLHADYKDLIGSDLYISRGESSKSSSLKVEPCQNCKRLIMNAQISRVFCRQPNGSVTEVSPNQWIESV
jgi:dCMP deaminase